MLTQMPCCGGGHASSVDLSKVSCLFAAHPNAPVVTVRLDATGVCGQQTHLLSATVSAGCLLFSCRSDLLTATLCCALAYMRQLCHPGRFGFVEMRTEELSHHAMNLDKVELCNRHVNVGRPKGYVEAAAPPPAAIGAAAAFAAQLGSEPSTVLRLDNMVKARLLLDARERSDVRAWALFHPEAHQELCCFPC